MIRSSYLYFPIWIYCVSTVQQTRVITQTPAQSQARAAPQPPAFNAPVKEFITPIHAYFKPGIRASVTSSVPNIPQKHASSLILRTTLIWSMLWSSRSFELSLITYQPCLKSFWFNYVFKLSLSQKFWITLVLSLYLFLYTRGVIN